ncbi:hypothetical protein QA600_21505 [Natronococcus sp. A-GB1]|uniref:hypothetical protein n=1 Tax=Natronococcus sp. A-GB1 TaxID=3037648 RepID=UPI00241F4EAF|nr:hypothetical protein [Natronococcus sp. A-GB1]MDG5761901.1 hypothetical protein [Natronococcus sp. A-GB1]
MTGGFYGALAASASVFVAILTALLVNDYVRIKADRRQLKHRLNRLESELGGLKKERDNHQAIVSEIQEEWEEDFRNSAEKHVEEFIESHVGTDFAKPIENLTLEEVYWELARYHGFETTEEMEGNALTPHHKNVLKEELEEIKQTIAYHFIKNFAEDYRGRGWEWEEEERSLKEVFDQDELLDETEIEDVEEGETDIPDSAIEVRSEVPDDPLDLEEFVEKYEDEHDLEELDWRSKELLRYHYDDIVDTRPMESFQDMFGNFSDFGSLDSTLAGLESIGSIPSDAEIAVSGMQSISERRQHDEAQNKVIQLNSRIGALEDEKESVKSDLQRLDPSDLKDALVANVLTIVFSVVVPMIAYLLTVVGFSLGGPAWFSTIEVFAVFGIWLLGLVVVFEWIYARIRSQDPKMNLLYNWAIR